MDTNTRVPTAADIFNGVRIADDPPTPPVEVPVEPDRPYRHKQRYRNDPRSRLRLTRKPRYRR